MSKKYRIKDIASLAGVSAGTVDRVLHNRGDVSPESKAKVEAILTQINYQHVNFLTAQNEPRLFKILVVMVQHTTGDYWDSVRRGIEEAIYELANVKLQVKYLYYDQFDMYSCRKAFDKALNMKSDAVIIGSTFRDETGLFANELFMRNIPYVFVDTMIENTQPLAFFGPHSFQTGVVQAKLLTTSMDLRKDIAIFQAKRIGDATSTQSVSRSYGFISYLKENFPEIKVHSAHYDYGETETNFKSFDSFFSEYTNIGGAVVFNTRAYLISEYLKTQSNKDIKLVGYGTNQRNIADLKAGQITFLISERPEYQGYKAVKATIDHLVYNKEISVENYTPIDILIKETVDFYGV